MRFDEILKYLGQFGTYQKRICFILCFASIFGAFHKLSWVFIGAVPDHRCRLPQDDVGGTSTFQLSEYVQNTTIPWDHVHGRWSRCKMYNNYAANETEVGNDVSKTARTCESWVYDQSQYHSTVVTEFDLVCHRNWMRPLSYTLYTVGEFMGALIIGCLSDRLGRRKVLIFCIIGEGIAGVLIGLIHNYYAFVILRVCVGIFTQSVLLSGFILGLEFVGPSKRVLVGMMFCYFFAFGYVLTAAVAYLVRDWYHLQIIMSAPILLFCLGVRWIPESARWLLSVNRPKEAMAIIHKAAKLNNIVLPAASLEVEVNANSDSLRQAGPLDIIRSSSMRKITLLVGYAWFVNTCVYYGSSLNTSNLGGNDYLNFLIAALVEFPAYTLCIWTLERYGRRLPTCLSMVAAGASILATAFVPARMTVVTITLTMIGKFGITVSYAIIYVYAAEVVPTQVRNVCIGFCSTCGRSGSMIMPFIILLGDYWRPLPFIILGFMSISSGLLVLLLPETNKRALPEIMKDVADTDEPKHAGAINGQLKFSEDDIPKTELRKMSNNFDTKRVENRVEIINTHNKI